MPTVVTCLLTDKSNRILILKRSKKVSTYNELWSGISGYIEKNETPLETAYKEIKEETNIDKKNVQLIKKLKPITFTDKHKGKKYKWTVHPFLFKIINNTEIKIDWENTEYRWIHPHEIHNYNTVPKLKDIITNSLPLKK